MRIAARLSAMVAAIIGGATHVVDRGRSFTRRNKVSRGNGYTARLYEKQAAARVERYALGIVERGRDGEVKNVLIGRLTDRDHVRRMRNARKRERQRPAPAFARPVAGGVQPCALFWSLRTHAARRKHMRGARGCNRCRVFIRAEAKARGIA